MRILVVIASLAVLLVGADSASACSCAFVPAKKLLKQADGGFNGRLLGVRDIEGTYEADYRYRVGFVAKGPFRRGRIVKVRSAADDAACGLMRDTGEVYGLFVVREGDLWRSGLCATVSPKRMRRAGRDAAASSCA